MLLKVLTGAGLQFEKYGGSEKWFRKDYRNLILSQRPNIVLDSYSLCCTKASFLFGLGAIRKHEKHTAKIIQTSRKPLG